MVDEIAKTAEDMAKEQREVSVSEFFEKNRHLLGYDNPTRALLTVVKELVDNSLDACEEARIIPRIWIEVKPNGVDRFRVMVKDNGPGMVDKQIPLALGKLLYGSKFFRLRQSRGQQGIGGCIVGDTLISLKDGRIEPIEKVVKKNEINAEVISYDYEVSKITKSSIANCVKNPSSSDFIHIKTYGGLKLTLTPEHLLPVKKKIHLQKEQVHAEDVKEGMFLLIGLCEHDITNPHEMPIPTLSLIDGKKYRIYNKDLVVELIENLKRKYGSYSEVARKLNIPKERLRGWYRDRKFRAYPTINNFFQMKSCINFEPEFDMFVDIGNYHHSISLPMILDEDLCWLLGFIASDGSMVKSDKKWGTLIMVTNKNEDLLDKSRNILEKLNLKYREYEHKGTSLHFGSIILSEIAEKFGINFNKKSHIVHMSDFVLQLPNRLLSKYIRGLFDGNGSIIDKSYGGMCIDYTTKSEKLAKQLQLVLLTRFGIFNSLRETKDKKYQIRIWKKDFIKKFLEKIGFSSHHSLQKLTEWVKKKSTGKAYYCVFDDNNWWVKVRSVKRVKLPSQPTYDLTIENHPYFLANGIVVHNSGAILYSQLTTGKPTSIVSSTGDGKTSFYELMIDVKKNSPEIISHQLVSDGKIWHGMKIEMEIEGRYIESKQSIPEYIKQVAIGNPYADIVFDGPTGRFEFPRGANELPPLSKEIMPHPHGIELGVLRRMLKSTKSRTVASFLTNDFSRVGSGTAKEICDLAGIDPKISPQRLEVADSEKLFRAMQKVKLVRPPTDCLSPLGKDLLVKGLKKEYKAEFFAAITRQPEVYRGNPFQVEVAIAYGGELPVDQTVKIIRLSNRVPLIYQEGDCAITKSIAGTDWRRYGLAQSGRSLPVGPAVILVHLASVWVPFVSESKQAIASYPVIIKEIKLALQEIGRQLQHHVSGKRRAEMQQRRREIFDRYLPEVANAIAKLTNKKPEPILTKLRSMIKKSTEAIVDGRSKEETGRFGK